MPGLKELPWEIQLIFWLLFVMIGILSAVVVYWAKRYIDAQDERLLTHEKKLSSISSDLTKVSVELQLSGGTAKAEIKDFQEAIEKAVLGTRDEVHLLSRDLSTAQTRLIFANDSLESLNKRTETLIVVMKSEVKKLEDSVGRIIDLEQNQSKIITVIQKISERFVKVGSKPDDSSGETKS